MGNSFTWVGQGTHRQAGGRRQCQDMAIPRLHITHHMRSQGPCRPLIPAWRRHGLARPCLQVFGLVRRRLPAVPTLANHQMGGRVPLALHKELAAKTAADEGGPVPEVAADTGSGASEYCWLSTGWNSGCSLSESGTCCRARLTVLVTILYLSMHLP